MYGKKEQKSVGTLEKVQTRALRIDGKWYKLSRFSKLNDEELTSFDELKDYVGSTVEYSYSNGWINELKIRRGKKANVSASGLSNCQELVKLVTSLEKDVQEIKRFIEELSDLISKLLDK